MPETREYAALSDTELVSLLFTEEDRLPRAAVDEILRRGVPVAPHLTRILDDDASWTLESPREWAPVHASYLLAAMQPPGALDVMIRALEKADRHAIRWITNPMPSLLAAFGPPAVDTLLREVSNRSREDWVRISLLEALHHLGADDGPSRDRIVDLFRSMASDASEPRPIRKWAALELLGFAAPGDRELLLSLAGGGAFEIMYNVDDVERALRGEERPRKADRDWLKFYDTDEIADRRRRWEDPARPATRDLKDVLDRNASSDILGDL